MGTLPIVTKRASHDPTTCVGCTHLVFDTNGHTVARCTQYGNRKLAEWGEEESVPKIRPLRIGCKERDRNL